MKKNWRFFIFLFILLGSFLWPRSASACRPVVFTPAEAFMRVDAVFSGTVLSVQKYNSFSYLLQSFLAQHFPSFVSPPLAFQEYSLFDVQQSWKGVGKTPVAVQHLEFGMCGLSFAPGQQYLVFANYSNNGHLVPQFIGVNPDPHQFLQNIPQLSIMPVPPGPNWFQIFTFISIGGIVVIVVSLFAYRKRLPFISYSE